VRTSRQAPEHDHAHRPEIVSALSGAPLGNLIAPEVIDRVLADLEAGRKGVPARAGVVVLINSGDARRRAALIYGHHAGSLAGMPSQKVTVHVDRDLLRRARERTRQGVTATIRHGLELVAASEAYEKLRALRGKVSFSLDLKKLREDRR
jgi:hypothetical protein